MLIPDAHSPEVSHEDKPSGAVCKGEKGKCGKGGTKELEKVKEDGKCFE